LDKVTCRNGIASTSRLLAERGSRIVIPNRSICRLNAVRRLIIKGDLL
jgi:hypothetical protein